MHFLLIKTLIVNKFFYIKEQTNLKKIPGDSMDNNSENKKGKGRFFNFSVGLIFIVLGIIFLLKNIYNNISIEKLWPLFMLIPVIFLTGTLLENYKKNIGTIVPIVILSVLMTYFLWLNYNGWHNVSITWPIFTLAPGLGLLSLFLFTRDRGLLIPSSILVIISAFFFGNIINSGVFIGAALIFIGIIVFITSITKRKP